MCWCQLIWMTQKNVSNYPQSEIDRAQKAVKMSAKIWLLLLCHILRWIIQFSMHNTPAGFVLLLLDFLHIQYILSEQTDMSCLFNNYKSRQFVFWNVCFFLIAKFRSHDSANIIKCFSCMLFVILRAPLSQRAPLRIHMIFHQCSKEFWEFMKFFHLHFFEKQSW